MNCSGRKQSAKFWKAYLDRYITRDDIQFLKRAGFNSIRVPIHYKYFESDDAEGFRLLDRVVEWSREAGLYVMIDMHAAPGGQTGANIDDSWGYPWLYDSPEAQQQTIAIWKRIAAHYRDSQTVLGYDLLNEPIPHFPELKKYNCSWSRCTSASWPASARWTRTTSSSSAGRNGTPTSPSSGRRSTRM